MYALSILGAKAEEAMRIPDPSRDRAFLYSEWQPNRLNVVVFIDPLCPYCKKAIPKLDEVTDYNLFVYWVPIFGQRSENIIRPFFRCEQPTSRAILSSLLVNATSSVYTAPAACEGDDSDPNFSDLRRAANDEMVASYPINGVPAFFLQGVQTSLLQIQTAHIEPARYVNGVALDWQRYKESRVNQSSSSGSLAIIFPEYQSSNLNRQMVERYRPEYLFSRNDAQARCDALSATACVDGEDVQRARLEQYDEIVALLGLDNHSGETFLLTRGGRLNSINANDWVVVD